MDKDKIATRTGFLCAAVFGFLSVATREEMPGGFQGGVIGFLFGYGLARILLLLVPSSPQSSAPKTEGLTGPVAEDPPLELDLDLEEDEERSMNIGVASYRAGDYANAIKYLSKTSPRPTTRHKLGELYTMLGTAYNKMDRYAESVEAYQLALKHNPSDHALLIGMGVSYRLKGSFIDAMKCYNRALMLAGDSAEAFSSLGVLYMTQGNAQMGLAFTKKAAELDPHNGVVIANLALAFAMNGRFHEADTHLGRAVHLGYQNGSMLRSRIDDLIETSSHNSSKQVPMTLKLRTSPALRIRLDYETPRQIELSMVLLDYHIGALKKVIPQYISQIGLHVPPEVCRVIVKQLDRPFDDYRRVTNLEATQEFRPLFPYVMQQEIASVIMQSVDSLPINSPRNLARKFLKYTLDLHTGMVPFTDEEINRYLLD